MAYYCSVTKSCLTLCDPMNCSTSRSFTISQSLLKLMSIQPSHPLSPLLLLPSIFPSIRVFSNESALLIRWPKYWSFSFSINLLPIQGWFPLGLTGLISLLSRGLSRVFSRTTQMALKISPRLTQLLSSWVSLCILVSLTQQTHPAPLSLEKAFLSAR